MKPSLLNNHSLLPPTDDHIVNGLVSDMKKTGPACYVSVDTFSDPTEADAFVRKITLSKPPG